MQVHVYSAEKTCPCTWIQVYSKGIPMCNHDSTARTPTPVLLCSLYARADTCTEHVVHIWVTLPSTTSSTWAAGGSQARLHLDRKDIIMTTESSVDYSSMCDIDTCKCLSAQTSLSMKCHGAACNFPWTSSPFNWNSHDLTLHAQLRACAIMLRVQCYITLATYWLTVVHSFVMTDVVTCKLIGFLVQFLIGVILLWIIG